MGCLDHEDVMKVAVFRVFPRYICGFGVYCWVRLVFFMQRLSYEIKNYYSDFLFTICFKHI